MAKDLIQFLSDQEIKPGTALIARKRDEAVKPPDLKQGTEQSFLSEKSIVSFASDISPQIREDILNTTLFAQMAANTVGNDEEKILDWYKKFIEVLGKTGWIVEGKDVQDFNAKGTLFEVENVIIDILTTAFGSGYMAIIKKTLDAIKGLSGDKKIKAFEKNVTGITKGCFQIAVAKEEKGAVSMRVGTFLISSDQKIQSILFFKSKKETTSVKYLSKQCTFNEKIFASARQSLIDKLGSRIATNIAEIELAG